MIDWLFNLHWRLWACVAVAIAFGSDQFVAFAQQADPTLKSLENPIPASYRQLSATDRQKINRSMKDALITMPDGKVVQWKLPSAYGSDLHMQPSAARFDGYEVYAIVVSQVADDYTCLFDHNDKALFHSGSWDLAEGDTIEVLARPSGTYEYVTVLGARRHIRQFSTPPGRLSTYNEFTAALRQGNAFLAICPVESRCTSCKGTKYTGDRRRRENCYSCNGTGMVKHDCCILLRK